MQLIQFNRDYLNNTLVKHVERTTKQDITIPNKCCSFELRFSS